MKRNLKKPDPSLVVTLSVLIKNEEGHLVFFTKQNQLITYTDQFNVYPVDLGDFVNVDKIHWLREGTFLVVVKERSGLSKPPNHALYVLNSKGTVLHCYKHHPSNCIFVYDIDKAGNAKYVVSKYGATKSLGEATFFRIDTHGVRQLDTLNDQYFKSCNVNFHRIGNASQFKFYQNHYWVYSEDLEFKLIDAKSGNTQFLSRQYPHLERTTDVFFDKKNRTWISTQFGVYCLSIQKSKFKQYLFNQKEKGRSRDFACRGMVVDRQNQLWVMVENGEESVWKVDLSSRKENSLYEILNKSPTHDLQGVKYANTMGKTGDIYFGINSRVSHINPLNNQYKTVLLSDEIPTFDLWTLHEDKHNKLWFLGTNNQGNRICNQ